MQFSRMELPPIHLGWIAFFGFRNLKEEGLIKHLGLTNFDSCPSFQVVANFWNQVVK